MDRTPRDVIQIILGYLDEQELAEACLLNSDFSKRICNNTFWINKIKQRFNMDLDMINKYKKNNTYWSYYLNLSRWINEYSSDELLSAASKHDRYDLINIALDRGANWQYIAQKQSPAQNYTKLRELAPEVFGGNYTRSCQSRYQPIILNPEQVELLKDRNLLDDEKIMKHSYHDETLYITCEPGSIPFYKGANPCCRKL